MPKRNKVLLCAKSQQEIAGAIVQYLGQSSEVKKEMTAFAYGAKIQGGDHALANLLPIAQWKSPRRKGLIVGNRQSVVTEILGLGCSATHERTAVAVLCGLSGVGVPMASAILTAMDRNRYTVIDRRVLAVLTGNRWEPIVDDYERYLGYCRKCALSYGVSLRDLDRALWTLGA